MFFYLSKIFGVFTSPSNLLVLVTLFCFAGLIWRPSRFFKNFAFVLAAVYLALAVLPVTDWTNYAWEQKYATNLKEKHNPKGIIVLSASIDPRMSAEQGQIALNGAAERVTIIPKLMKQYPNAKIVYTGGSGLMMGAEMREADFAKKLFAEWNLPLNHIVFERNSRNTYENAVFSKELVKPKKGEEWLLVTSALHLPRSAAIFKKIGWDVTPYPVDFKSMRAPPLSCFCFDSNLTDLDGLAHEWVGYVMYKATGKL